MTFVLGLDGCPGGWCGVRIDVRQGDARPSGPEMIPTFAAALATPASVIAVDIPIGLLDAPGPRACDHEARRLLGRPVASSVFPAPSRKACSIRDYWQASAINLEVTGRRLTRQTFNITPRVAEVDAVMSPDLQTLVYEVHPELAFWALNCRRALTNRKKRRAGREERWALLQAALPSLPAIPPAPAVMPRGCAIDDYLDAMAAAWTALCIFEGRAHRIPLSPQKDARGLRMEIWYPG